MLCPGQVNSCSGHLPLHEFFVWQRVATTPKGPEVRGAERERERIDVAVAHGETGWHHDRPAHRAGRPALELKAGRIVILAWWRTPRCGHVTRVGPLRIACGVPRQQRMECLITGSTS